MLDGVKCFLQIIKALEDLGAALDIGFYHFLIHCLCSMWDPLLFQDGGDSEKNNTFEDLADD